MIYSIGHDIVENKRIAKIISEYGMRGVRKFLTIPEVEIYLKRENKIKFIAKRFAAKEAFAKACGTGLIAPVTLANISVLNDALGKPYFELAAELKEWIKSRGITSWHLSISDEKSITSAIVVFES